MEEQPQLNSSQQLFRSGLIVGTASGIGLVIGVIKVKALALLLGAAGVGLAGIFLNIVSLASTLAGCGIRSSGVRELSVAEEHSIATVRRALWTVHLILGVVGLSVLWVFRHAIATVTFGDDTYAATVGYLGIGVFFTLVTSSQSALLQGLRRISDIARVNILSALLSAIAGICTIWYWGSDGILLFVLVVPIAGFFVSGFFVRRIESSPSNGSWSDIPATWLALIRLGLPIMGGSLLILVTELATRSIISRTLSLEATGYFQAVWSISMTYIGFILVAMGTDYFPRLSKIIKDHRQATVLINEQVEIALLMTGPILLLMISLASYVIPILYSPEFEPAIDVLRWQMLGDILKVSVWPMGFILLALSRGDLFFGTQFIWSCTFLGVVILGVPQLGILASGIGFCVSYLAFFFVMLLLANHLIGFRLQPRNSIFLLSLLTVAISIIIVSSSSLTIGVIFGILSTLVVSAYCIWRLDELIGIRAWLINKFNV